MKLQLINLNSNSVILESNGKRNLMIQNHNFIIIAPFISLNFARHETSGMSLYQEMRFSSFSSS